MFFEDQRAVDRGQITRRQIILAREDVRVLADQQAKLAGVVGVLQRDEQILEIAPAELATVAAEVAEEIGVGQVDLINDRRAQAVRQPRQVDFRALADAPEIVGAVWIDRALGKAPCGQAEIFRLKDHSGVRVEREALGYARCEVLLGGRRFAVGGCRRTGRGLRHRR